MLIKNTLVLFFIIFTFEGFSQEDCFMGYYEFEALLQKVDDARRRDRYYVAVNYLRQTQCKLTNNQHSILSKKMRRRHREDFFYDYVLDFIQKSSADNLINFISNESRIYSENNNCTFIYGNYKFKINSIEIVWRYGREAEYKQRTCVYRYGETTIIDSRADRLPTFTYHNIIYINSKVEGGIQTARNKNVSGFNMNFNYNNFYIAFVIYHTIKELQKKLDCDGKKYPLHLVPSGTNDEKHAVPVDSEELKHAVPIE